MILAADAASQATDPTTLVILIGGGAMVMYVMTRMTRARKKADPMDKTFQSRSLSQQRNLERDFENLIVQLSDMSRQMSAQLDTRAAKLEALIADADERAERLKAIVQQTPARPVFREVDDAAGAESAWGSTARDTVADAKAAASAAAFENLAPAPRVDPQHAEIYRLADGGRIAREIAIELNRPSGEVELILALRGKGEGGE